MDCLKDENGMVFGEGVAASVIWFGGVEGCRGGEGRDTMWPVGVVQVVKEMRRGR